MKIREIISELTFYGRQCTKDCSGHTAGWNWANRKNIQSPGDCNSRSNSFNGGCRVALDQKQRNQKITYPRVRDERGRFYNRPKMR